MRAKYKPAAIVAVTLLLTAAALACAIEEWAPDFADFNVRSETLGPRLGAVQSGGALYWISAYRDLTGHPLTPVEQESLRQTWPDYDADPNAPNYAPPFNGDNGRNRWITEWVLAAGRVAGDEDGKAEGVSEGINRHEWDGRTAPGVYK